MNMKKLVYSFERASFSVEAAVVVPITIITILTVLLAIINIHDMVVTKSYIDKYTLVEDIPKCCNALQEKINSCCIVSKCEYINTSDSSIKVKLTSGGLLGNYSFFLSEVQSNLFDKNNKEDIIKYKVVVDGINKIKKPGVK